VWRCSFQDLAYEEQLHQKKIYLTEVLKKYFPADYRYLEIKGVRPSPAEYYYRNKMEFSFGQSEEEIYLGLRDKTRTKTRRRQKNVVRLDRCLISTALAEQLFLFSSNWLKNRDCLLLTSRPIRDSSATWLSAKGKPVAN